MFINVYFIVFRIKVTLENTWKVNVLKESYKIYLGIDN